MTTPQDNNIQQKPEQWSYKEPHRYPIPRSNEDPWETLLEPLLAKDRVQCEAWKDEVQNLLIFAGLFSAVVTSFVVESSKDLRSDPNTLLLSHIATLLANGANGTNASIPLELQFSPSPSSYRINTLWFASLVLSLTTVLVGIVSLQWIREHQRYSGLSLQDKFSVFCMRKEALEAWYVPHIFAGLPLLFQGALALYLAGLVDHLLGFGPGVAIPGITFIFISLFFLIATTVLPTLQGLVILPTYLERTSNLPSPCPYKSPQSQVFRRLTTAFQKSFLAASWLMARVQWLIMHSRKFLYRFIQLEASQPRFVRTSHEFPSILTIWRKVSWVDFDCSWLSLHDCMLLNVVHGELRNRHYRPTQPLYDAVKGIRTIARGNDMNPPDPYLFAQFHCLHDLSSSVIGKDANGTYAQTYRNRYFRFLLNLKSSNDLDQKSGFLSNMLTIFRFDSRFVSEENTIAILDIVNPDQELSPTLSRHFAECNLRLLAAVYSKAHRLDRESEPQKSPPLMISPFSLTRAIWSIKEDEIKTEFVRQWSLCIHAFFSTIIHSSPDDLYLKHSFHSHTFFRWYLQTFRNQVYSTTYDSLDSEILTIVVSTITEISVALNDFPNPQRDFLFCVASYYAKLLATGNFRSGHPNVVSAVSTLLEALRNYKAHDHLVWEILRMDKIMETPSFSDKEWWGFLNSPEASIYSSRHSGMGVEGGTMRLSASVQRVPKAASCRVRSHPDIPSFS